MEPRAQCSAVCPDQSELVVVLGLLGVGLEYEWTGKVTDYLTTLDEYEVSDTRLAMMRLEYRLFEHLTKYFLLETNTYDVRHTGDWWWKNK